MPGDILYGHNLLRTFLNMAIDEEPADMQPSKATDEAELQVRGFGGLNRALGPSEALRFLALFHREPTDYVEVSKKVYEGQTVDELFKRAKEHWKG